MRGTVRAAGVRVLLPLRGVRVRPLPRLRRDSGRGAGSRATIRGRAASVSVNAYNISIVAVMVHCAQIADLRLFSLSRRIFFLFL